MISKYKIGDLVKFTIGKSSYLVDTVSDNDISDLENDSTDFYGIIIGIEVFEFVRKIYVKGYCFRKNTNIVSLRYFSIFSSNIEAIIKRSKYYNIDVCTLCQYKDNSILCLRDDCNILNNIVYKRNLFYIDDEVHIKGICNDLSERFITGIYCNYLSSSKFFNSKENSVGNIFTLKVGVGEVISKFIYSIESLYHYHDNSKFNIYKFKYFVSSNEYYIKASKYSKTKLIDQDNLILVNRYFNEISDIKSLICSNCIFDELSCKTCSVKKQK